MEPRIEWIAERKIVGKRMIMSLAGFQPAKLWSSFMPGRESILNRIGTDLLSVSIYKPGYFSDFSPANTFEKWAAVEVSGFDSVPEGMERFTIPEGSYAVFDYKGAGDDNRIFSFIFGEWIPSSEYEVDNRPHFEVLGPKFRNNDPGSEEEIWIPVCKRA